MAYRFRLTALLAACTAPIVPGMASAQTPEIDTSAVTGMSPGEVGRRALGQAAGDYAGVAVVELPLEDDQRASGFEPYQWPVMFFKAPRAVAPGICFAVEDEVGVIRGSANPAAPEFNALRAVVVRPHKVYRIVGDLAAVADAPPDKATAARCDALKPVQDHFLDRDVKFPGAIGAFDASSTAEAWQAAALARKFVGGKGIPALDCMSGGSTCNEALAALRKDPMAPVYRVDTVRCRDAALGDICVELSLNPAPRAFCVMRFGTMRDAPLEVRSVRLNCNAPDTRPMARRIS